MARRAKQEVKSPDKERGGDGKDISSNGDWERVGRGEP